MAREGGAQRRTHRAHSSSVPRDANAADSLCDGCEATQEACVPEGLTPHAHRTAPFR